MKADCGTWHIQNLLSLWDAESITESITSERLVPEQNKAQD